MDDDSVLALIREAFREVVPERADQAVQLTLDSEISQLGIDSVRTLEMIGWIEDRLARTFDEDELAKVKTFRGVALLIQSGEATLL